jgi:hypothetical protein
MPSAFSILEASDKVVAEPQNEKRQGAAALQNLAPQRWALAMAKLLERGSPLPLSLDGLCHWSISILFAAFFCIDTVCGQNIVSSTKADFTANPVALTDTDVSECIYGHAGYGRPIQDAEAQRVANKLAAHVDAFVNGFPWMPFHHTLGISGYEACFDHPDEMFYALSVALPSLPPATRDRARRFLASQLATLPPYAREGFDRRIGRARESYDVPPALRLTGRGQARSAFGVYAFWAYCHYSDDKDATQSHWPAIKDRIKPLLETDYKFDLRRTNSVNDEAEILNGDLAGLIGCVRLARLNRAGEMENLAFKQAAHLLRLRVNLERVNPKIVEPTRSATIRLHNFKLARYCGLVPETGEALRKWTDGCAAARLKSFREERNAWYLAFGDRMIGGENYTNPLHFPRAVFAGAAFIECLDAAELLRFIDVPWCQGDFYFIESCADALWAAGRPWAKIE